MFFNGMFARTYTKKVHLTSEPTKEILDTLYKEYEPTNVKDQIVTIILHRYLVKKFRSGFVDGPGDYKMSFTVSFPIMFWSKVYYDIERL